MTALELLNKLKADIEFSDDTVDTLKSGNGDVHLKKVAVSMFGTPDVISDAVRWGADLLIVHEPIFYQHMDTPAGYEVEKLKRDFVEKSGITVFRYHDYAHSRKPDLIFEGEMKFMGLKGKVAGNPYYAVNRFELDSPMTASELAKHLESRLNIKQIRIAGASDKPGKLISCCFGIPGHIAEELQECDFVFAGEIREWDEGEMAKEYAQLGYGKAILVLGHIGSERDGMKLLTEELANTYKDISFRYFECEELYN